ncbi:TldD/PmbA family protein [Candidatus Bathyarchaeota archaeon]|nr:MAG: TldD/PmbA family protein [Candidatus Bathyarchaeota archaeon]
METSHIADRLIRFGAEDGDYMVTKSDDLIIDFTDKIRAIRFTSGYTVYIRVSVGKHVGFYTSNDLSPEGIEEAAKTAVKIAEVSPEDPYWVGAPRGLGLTDVEGIYDKRLAELTPDEAVDMVKSAMEGVSTAKPGVRPVRGSLRINVREYTIGNLNGEEVSRRGTSIFIYISGRAEEPGRSAVYTDFQNSRSLDRIKPYELGREVGLKAYEFLDAEAVSTGLYDLILDGRVAASIFRIMLSQAVSADAVQMGRSPLAGKVGCKLLSENITFVDDGTVPGYVGSKPCDDEGIPVRRNVIFDRGVLKTYLYDTYTANKENRRSTGNAHRSVGASTVPLPNNLILNPGDYTLEEMVEDTSKGVYVLKTIGEWLSNPVSGFLNATVTHGYFISNGSIAGRVKGAVIGGDFYQLMNVKVVGLSKELYESMSSYSPHVKFEKVQLSSK